MLHIQRRFRLVACCVLTVLAAACTEEETDELIAAFRPPGYQDVGIDLSHITSARLPDGTLTYGGDRYVIRRSRLSNSQTGTSYVDWVIVSPFGTRHCKSPTVEACIEALEDQAREYVDDRDHM